MKSQHEKVKEICETCGKSFSKQYHLNRHVIQFHPETVQEKRKPTETLKTRSKRIKINEDVVNNSNEDDDDANKTKEDNVRT